MVPKGWLSSNLANHLPHAFICIWYFSYRIVIQDYSFHFTFQSQKSYGEVKDPSNQLMEGENFNISKYDEMINNSKEINYWFYINFYFSLNFYLIQKITKNKWKEFIITICQIAIFPLSQSVQISRTI